MDQKSQTSIWFLVFDTISLCLISIELGFFGYLIFLQSIDIGGAGLAAPILAFYCLVIWPIVAIVCFVILRVAKRLLFASNALRYFWYAVSVVVPCIEPVRQIRTGV